MPHRILFFDLATRTGWCFGSPGEPPRYGSFTVAPPGSDVGAFASAYRQRAALLIAQLEPTAVIYEAPFVDQEKTALDTAEKLLGLVVLTQMVTFESRVMLVRKIENSTVAKYFTGKGRWPGGTKAKKQMTIMVCQRLGWTPANDDEADALAGWSFSCHLLAPAEKKLRWEGALLGVGTA